jgi:hypothetical protein
MPLVAANQFRYFHHLRFGLYSAQSGHPITAAFPSLPGRQRKNSPRAFAICSAITPFRAFHFCSMMQHSTFFFLNSDDVSIQTTPTAVAGVKVLVVAIRGYYLLRDSNGRDDCVFSVLKHKDIRSNSRPPSSSRFSRCGMRCISERYAQLLNFKWGFRLRDSTRFSAIPPFTDWIGCCRSAGNLHVTCGILLY